MTSHERVSNEVPHRYGVDLWHTGHKLKPCAAESRVKVVVKVTQEAEQAGRHANIQTAVTVTLVNICMLA